MYARKIKRKCGVRGCRNTDSYAISRVSEPGNSVIICKDCLKAALGVIEDAVKMEDGRPMVAPTEEPKMEDGRIASTGEPKAVKRKGKKGDNAQ